MINSQNNGTSMNRFSYTRRCWFRRLQYGNGFSPHEL